MSINPVICAALLAGLVFAAPAWAGPSAPHILPPQSASAFALVHAGQTRAVLERRYVGEGGISTRVRRVYVLRDRQTGRALQNPDGSFTKVRVEFRPFLPRYDREGRLLGLESARDVITKISPEYLQSVMVQD